MTESEFKSKVERAIGSRAEVLASGNGSLYAGTDSGHGVWRNSLGWYVVHNESGAGVRVPLPTLAEAVADFNESAASVAAKLEQRLKAARAAVIGGDA